MKISVIFPVCAYPDPKDENGAAHPYLLSSLDSILHAGDVSFELLIGVDGDRPKVIEILQYWKDKNSLSEDQIKIFIFPFSGSYGNAQRNYLIARATGDYLSFMDHDDEYVNNAFKAIEQVAANHPQKPLMFRMRVYQLQKLSYEKHFPLVLWRTELPGVIQQGLVGGHMIVVPNDKTCLSFWPEKLYEADFQFILKTVENFREIGKELVWVDYVLSNVRPWAYKKINQLTVVGSTNPNKNNEPRQL